MSALLSGVSVVDVFSAACAAVATASAVYVALRDGRWRKNGLAKQLSDRIDAAQAAADRWHETEPAKVLKADVNRHEVVLARHDGALEQQATKEDIARMEGETRRVADAVENAASGVERIESMLLRRALDPMAAR